MPQRLGGPQALGVVAEEHEQARLERVPAGTLTAQRLEPPVAELGQHAAQDVGPLCVVGNQSRLLRFGRDLVDDTDLLAFGHGMQPRLRPPGERGELGFAHPVRLERLALEPHQVAVVGQQERVTLNLPRRQLVGQGPEVELADLGISGHAGQGHQRPPADRSDGASRVRPSGSIT